MKKDAETIQEKAKELENEVAVASRRADHFDGSEIFLEIAIVLCSITMLTGSRTCWRASFISGAIGLALMASTFLIR